MKTRSVKIPLEATLVIAKMDLKAMAVSAAISMNAKTPLSGYDIIMMMIIIIIIIMIIIII